MGRRAVKGSPLDTAAHCSCAHLHKVKTIKSCHNEPGVMAPLVPTLGRQSKFQGILVKLEM